MLAVPDLEATIAWYRAVGFELQGSHDGESGVDWASLKLGAAEIMFVPSGETWRGRTTGLSLWMRTERLDDLYAHLQRQQLARAAAVLAGKTPERPEVRFRADLYTAFYGQREFSIEDPNGVELCFYQPLEQPR
jgi:catechol 2,3-dioxygenase-like lactoylglutathione lyase family enzyme